MFELFDLPALIRAVGYAGLFGIIFAESGLLIGFFLPGDSLLFTAGFLASQGLLDIRLLAPLLFVAAVLGDSVGYTFGNRVGWRIFVKEDSLLFHRDHLIRARNFFERHGGKTIVLARFIPIVRTFAPILAGVGKMRYPQFLFYNVLGAGLWAIGLTLLGYYLGIAIPNIDRYLIPIIALIILTSVFPGIYKLAKDRTQRARVVNFVSGVWRKILRFLFR